MTAIERAQRREAKARELLPMIEGALRNDRLEEALAWISEALQHLEAGELYAMHLRALDTLLGLACVAVELARATRTLQETADDRVRRCVALRLYAVTGRKAA